MAPIEIDGLPNLKMVIFHGELLNNQMVNRMNQYFRDGISTPAHKRTKHLIFQRFPTIAFP
jgi:hypothetical protein